MPVKTRRSKRRGTAPEMQVDMWAGAFEHGADYFGDIVIDGTHPYWTAPIPRDVFEAQWRWLGAAYLSRREPTPAHVPYALREFGDP